MDFNEDGFRQAVERHWHHRRRSNHIHWSCRLQPDEQGCFIETAPVIQEIYAGEHDGAVTFAAFMFDLDEFFKESGLVVETSYLTSLHVDDGTPPYFAIEGTYWNVPFILKMQLEPMSESEPVEVIDMLNEELRDKE
jgi:hypothetical protein